MTEKPQIDLKTILQSLKKGAGIEIPDDIMDKVEKSTPKEQAEFFGRFMENVHKEVEKNMAQGNSVEPKAEGAKEIQKGKNRASASC